MKVSFVIPVYNVERYLEQCVDSILNQSYKDIEVILVDDGSTDKTLDVVQMYADQDSRIKVISRAPNQGKHTAWLCKCQCGNEVIIRGDQLRNGIAKSCGCLAKEKAAIRCQQVGKNNLGRPSAKRENLIGQTFERLSVIELGKVEKGRVYWKCLCTCGNEILVQTNHLKSGHTKSCGCLNSMGEEKISKILQQNGINYIQQYSFEDLRDKNKLKFDFAIFQNQSLLCLIEYQGSQHFQNLEGKLWNSPQQHDAMKRAYCYEHNIPLIEISYKDYDKIDINYLKERYKQCMDIQME